MCPFSCGFDDDPDTIPFSRLKRSLRTYIFISFPLLLDIIKKREVRHSDLKKVSILLLLLGGLVKKVPSISKKD